MRPNRFALFPLAVLLLLLIGTTSVLARVVSSSSAFLHRSLETRIGLFCNGNPVNWTDPTGRIATPVLQNAGTQASNLSHSIADTVLDAVPGGISALFSIAGAGFDLIGQPHHLYRDAAWINERLSPYARHGYYDPNSLVATAVAAGSVIVAPGSAPTKIASKSLSAQAAVKPLFGKQASAITNVANSVPKAFAKETVQLEFGFIKNLGNPKFVLYKASEFNLSMLRPGEYTLNLPWLRKEALDWAQNQQALQKAMNIGIPIREANPNVLGGWLQHERDFMSSQSWQRIQQGNDVFWRRPSGQ